MFGRIVKDIDGHRFETVLERHKEKASANKDTDLGVPELKAIVAEFKDLYRREVGEDFPQDPIHQLRESVAAVLRSRYGQRGAAYPPFQNNPHHLGTAPKLCMVRLSNKGTTSATTLSFTADTATSA